MSSTLTKHQPSDLAGFHYVWVESPQPSDGQERKALLLLHGTGGSEFDLLEMGRAISSEAGLLSPRGRVLEGTSNRFFRRVSEGVFDLEDLKKRTHELAEFVVNASRLHKFERSQMTAVGFSNGANIAASLLLIHPGLIGSAILFSPMVPLEPEKPVDLKNTRVFIGAGNSDTIASVEDAQRLAAILRGSRADVVLYNHAGGHTITRGELDAAASWLAG